MLHLLLDLHLNNIHNQPLVLLRNRQRLLRQQLLHRCLYTFLNNGNPDIYTYADGKLLDGIQSIYFQGKYDSPATTWSHIPGDKKITVLYTTYLQPKFMTEKLFEPLKKLME